VLSRGPAACLAVVFGPWLLCQSSASVCCGRCLFAMVEKPYIDQLIEDFGGEFVASMVVGIVASLLTTHAIRWLVQWNREQLGRPVAITAICVGLYVEFVMLISKSKANNDSTRKLFLLRSLAVFFGAIAGGQIAQILWTLKWG
jgi:hypothetical protein